MLALHCTSAPAPAASRGRGPLARLDRAGQRSNSPRLITKLSASSQSTYELAAIILGLDELRADQTFEATAVDEAAAHLLEAAPGSSAFRVTSQFTTPDGEPVEFRTVIYPAGRYSFHIRRIVPISR